MYHLRLYKDLLACEASAIDFASVFIITHSLSARRWCCLAFFALLGANLESLSTNASLNLSALGNSDASDEVATAIFGHLRAAHVPGAISFTTGSSSATPGNASRVWDSYGATPVACPSLRAVWALLAIAPLRFVTAIVSPRHCPSSPRQITSAIRALALLFPSSTRLEDEVDHTCM
ncbi:hypothetical protein CKAN_01514200 [Cinnamomum micranthum f. kanehirae]|uniref:Uncharacterized protein n=1 Tax=Cinnamomum micranthum f. kanehirae TaxID=337451 RepID=A0A3S3N123_9MAGN|nr:hypothetical protein CKAN_01514200 [Cinnamomum micranthum f. kanehirae]